MSDDAPATPVAGRPPRRWITIAAWSVAAPLTLPACAWLISDESYRADLIANLGAQFLLLTLVTLALVAALRRWRPALLLLACCGLHLIPLLTGRAAYWPREVSAAGTARPAGVVRILHYNDSTQSSIQTIEHLFDSSNADVIHLLCPSIPAQNAWIYGDGLKSRWPGVAIRPWQGSSDGFTTSVTAAIVVSRWPIRPIDLSGTDPMADHLLAGIVERPGGPFAVIAAHPRSPRTLARWLEGNATTAALVTAVRTIRKQGLPVVVLADLNSTPTGFRSRLLVGQAGLSRCKPVFMFDGTHPDQVSRTLMAGDTRTLFKAFWPIRIAIDDAFVSPEIGVAGWSVLPAINSEHSPVLVELTVPVSGTSARPPAAADR